jgi:hypothetical protein
LQGSESKIVTVGSSNVTANVGVKLTVGETGRSSKVEHELKGFCANGNEGRQENDVKLERREEVAR